jgi:hypothetical protein
LERIVSDYLDLAEIPGTPGHCHQHERLGAISGQILAITDYPILLDKGKVSA